MIKIVFVLSALLCAVGLRAQENQVNRLPEIRATGGNNNYMDNNTGFWLSAEASGAYTCFIGHANVPVTEVDVTGGYRFGEYLRVGIGFGGRYYINNDKLRSRSTAWAFPIYFNVRGNFMPTDNRSVVPYWSVDLGGAVQDGFMLRPTVGLRIGQLRKAFLVGIGYTGQQLDRWEIKNNQRVGNDSFVSMIHLRLGYEF